MNACQTTLLRRLPTGSIGRAWLIAACLVAWPHPLYGQKAPPFRLTQIDGSPVDVAAGGAELTVVCFLGAECPLARLYGPRLERLHQEFASRGVRFVGLNSNVQDSAEDVQRYVVEHQLTFPVAKDPDNQVADGFSAERTPEVFVLDRDLRVLYRGRIDDQYLPGVARPEPQRQDLRQALEEALDGRAVKEPRTTAVGCLIGRVKPESAQTTATYCRDIAPLLQRHCVECHRPGEIGPFALTEYSEVAGWSEMILEVVEQGRMPPWHAHPDHGEFVNERRMTTEEKKLLRQWVRGGAPKGDPDDLPEPVEFTQGWQLERAPDLVLSMRDRPFEVVAEGAIEYQYFVVDPGFEEDKWISAAQVNPGNRSVVHHSIVFVRPPDGAAFRGIGWLAAYVPGQRNNGLPPGHAIRVPARSKLVFQQHYTPTGAPQRDTTEVGMLFLDAEQVTHEVFTLIGIEQEFEIPPQAEKHEVEFSINRLPDNARLLAVIPHMHLRGRSFRLYGETQQQRTILLDVPRYDFNWQHRYEFREPLTLAAWDRLHMVTTFDNSPSNPVNPDPDQRVFWGDQTWEEMAVAFFEVAQPLEQSGSYASSRRASSLSTTDQEAAAERIAEGFLRRFDGNGDGVVEKFELPLATRRFVSGLWEHDNGDDRLTREEILQAARRRALKKRP